MFLRKLRENSQPIAILFAFCLAVTAQYLFTGEIFTHQLATSTWFWTKNYSMALIMLLLAIGFSTWASLPRDNTAEDATEPIRLQTDGLKGNLIWFIGSGICYMLSIIIYLRVGENSLVQWLWVAGCGVLLIPLWLQSKGKSAEDKIPSWEWLLVGIISLIGFGLRYWKLTEIPSHVDNDIALMGNYGIELISLGNYNWIGYSNSQHLLSYDQLQAWSMRLFGQNHYGIVMHSVVLGTVSLILVFLLGRELGGPFVGFAGIGLLAISYTHIHFSRILFGNSASFIAIFVFYTYFKGLRTREPFWYAITGVLIGVGLLLYDSGRIIPLIILSIVVWLWLWQRQSFKSMYKNWGILFAGIFLGFGPMLAYAIRNFTNFSGRANIVLLWSPGVWEHEVATYQATTPIQVLWQQTWRTFLTLHLTGDGSPHFSFPHPMISPIASLFFILGLGYALSRIKNIKYFSLLSWIFLTFIFGGVLTADPPYWPHLNIALPAIILVAALGTKSLANKITVVFGRIGYGVYSWVLISIIIFTGINNWQIYYDYVRNNAGNRIRIARYLESLPSSYSAYMVSEYFSWSEHAFRFFSQGITGQDITSEMLANNPPVIERPTVFILFRHPELVSILQEQYPDGALENHYDYDNLVSFISYRVVPSTIDVPPDSFRLSTLNSPGWLLIFGLIIFWVGYVAYEHYSARETSEGKKHSTTAQLTD